ncbi:MAG: Gfo/Idh/MocA family oxidoreductase [Bacilli bacterium]|nr:Gfo/Idh/MocA family oxidoreductase [Bacilli bacterium]
MNKKIKLAFLGGGINSAVGQTHRIAIEMDKRYELVAGCFSRNDEINVNTAKEYEVNLNRCYKSLDDLIENEKNNIDAICILTPTPNHKEEVIKCIQNGIKVICEKALAVSVKEAFEIKEALEKYKGFLVVTYNYTGYPMLRELKAMIKQNRLGKIEQVHIEMPQESFAKLDKHGNPQKPQDWRLKDNDLPTLSLDLGTHTHDITSFLTEEHPIELVAIQNSFGSFRNIVDNSIAIANYTNGIVSNIWFSKAALGHRNGLRVRVYGENGSAEWFQLDSENLYFNDNRGNKLIIDRASLDVTITTELRYNRFKAGHPAGFIEAFANYYSDIADLIIGKTDNKNRYVFGIEDALEGLKMLEAMTKSSKNKGWEKI